MEKIPPKFPGKEEGTEGTETKTDVLWSIASLVLTATDDELFLASPLETTTDGDATVEYDSSKETTDGKTDVLWSIARLKLTATDDELLLARLLETTTKGDATAENKNKMLK